jgi:hypothetical protein
MKSKNGQNEFRQVGKGFIVNQMEGMIVGRMLTQIYVDNKKQPYVKVNGEIVPLTAQHNYLAA